MSLVDISVLLAVLVAGLVGAWLYGRSWKAIAEAMEEYVAQNGCDAPGSIPEREASTASSIDRLAPVHR